MALYESWSVGVFFRATSNLSTVMMAGARSTGTMNAQVMRQNALLAQRQRVLRAQAYLFASLAGISALALGMGIKNAGDLQVAMTTVGIATHTATNHMQRFYELTQLVSSQTAQNITTITQELAVAAQSGLSNVSQLMKAFPMMARAADVLWISRGTDPVDSIRQMSQMAHLFGTYSGPRFLEMVTRAVQMQYVQPETLQRILTQGKYFIGPGQAAGMSQDSIIQLLMAMGQTGFARARGGMGVRSAIQYLVGGTSLTSHMTALRKQAFEAFDLFNKQGQMRYINKHGGLDFMPLMAHLEQMRTKFRPVDFSMYMGNAFGAAAQQFLTTLLLPNVWEKYKMNWKQLMNLGSLEQIWERYTHTWPYQSNLLFTNVQSIFTQMGRSVLPMLTNIAGFLGGIAGSIATFFAHNQKAAFIATIAAFTATATLAGAAVVDILALNASILTLGKTSKVTAAELGGTGLLSAVRLWGGYIMVALGATFSGLLNTATFGLFGRLAPTFAQWASRLIAPLLRVAPGLADLAEGLGGVAAGLARLSPLIFALYAVLRPTPVGSNETRKAIRTAEATQYLYGLHRKGIVGAHAQHQLYAHQSAHASALAATYAMEAGVARRVSLQNTAFLTALGVGNPILGRILSLFGLSGFGGEAKQKFPLPQRKTTQEFKVSVEAPHITISGNPTPQQMQEIKKMFDQFADKLGKSIMLHAETDSHTTGAATTGANFFSPAAFNSQ